MPLIPSTVQRLVSSLFFLPRPGRSKVRHTGPARIQSVPDTKYNSPVSGFTAQSIREKIRQDGAGQESKNRPRQSQTPIPRHPADLRRETAWEERGRQKGVATSVVAAGDVGLHARPIERHGHTITPQLDRDCGLTTVTEPITVMG
ncbi:hypothetical protein SKAU_G00352360 [Synaphobranchus kaupii]|uniref:Uncharacterized protein n=1 Tax=Synaphobranchus kaupii TaxID=118154 RepID=A0A9Q1IG47_SYNKA|nr:hypothetical protein SKAU_G00352360 [Synaphobranchus kaupii]